jgi:hypothetical protein
MRIFSLAGIGALVVHGAFCLMGQTAPPPTSGPEPQIWPPRAAPADYQSQGKAGTLAIGAEFKGHSVPLETGTLKSEDYIIVEVGLFGGTDGRAKISTEDFSLRVNGKKSALPSQPYGLVVKSVKDPEWEPPASAKNKPKTSMSGGGGQGETADAPPPKMPFELVRAMQLRVQKASLPEGERALPVAGFVYFPYRGKAEGIKSLELIYEGAAGQTTMTLEP